MSDKYNTIEKVHKRALESIGLTLGEIDAENLKNVNNKAYPGNVIEQVWFEHPADNIAEPDFIEAGVELKVTPIDIAGKGKKAKIKAGERLVLNKINYKNEYGKTFEESSFWNKNKIIELIQYYRRDTANKKKIASKEIIEDKRKFKIAYANILAMEEIRNTELPKDSVIQISDKDFEIIKQDWYKISEYINASKAEELSEGLTNYLGACTKSATGDDFTTQFGSDISPKPRAYSFKPKFMNMLLNNHIIGENHEDAVESIIKDSSELKEKTLEQVIASKFETYIGWSKDKLLDEFYPLKSKTKLPKNINNILVRGMLGLSISNKEVDSEETKKAEISIKTVELENGKPDENTKFIEIPSFIELVTESWEESVVYNFFESTKVMFIVFDNTNKDKEKDNNKIYFKGIKFWNMPNYDLEGICKKTWEIEIEKLRSGVELTYTPSKIKNNFIKPTDEGTVLCLRPSSNKRQYRAKYRDEKGKNRNNARELPAPAKWINRPENKQEEFTDNYMTKQAWWLSKEYVFEQIKDVL